MSLSSYSKYFITKNKLNNSNKNLKFIDYFSILKKIKYKQLKYFKSKTRGVLGKLKHFDSQYWSSTVLDYINKTDCIRHTYLFNVKNVSFKVAFIIYNNSDDKNKLDEYIKWIHMVACLLSHLATTKQYFDIQIFFTHFTKTLPPPKNVLDSNNCNSALIHVGKNHQDICIYRREEWFKVLIHELLHGFKVDKNINMFFINSSISEGYVEYLARYLNCIISAYILSETKQSFNKLFSLFITVEIDHSTIQVRKILKHLEIKYSDFFKESHHYREKTNVFSYYFIALYFLIYSNDFINLLKKYNTKIYIINDSTFLTNFILTVYRSNFLIDELRKREKYIDNSLRMSAIELI